MMRCPKCDSPRVWVQVRLNPAGGVLRAGCLACGLSRALEFPADSAAVQVLPAPQLAHALLQGHV